MQPGIILAGIVTDPGFSVDVGRFGVSLPVSEMALGGRRILSPWRRRVPHGRGAARGGLGGGEVSFVSALLLCSFFLSSLLGKSDKTGCQVQGRK